jgi:hypothetical protein
MGNIPYIYLRAEVIFSTTSEKECDKQGERQEREWRASDGELSYFRSIYDYDDIQESHISNEIALF